MDNSYMPLGSFHCIVLELIIGDQYLVPAVIYPANTCTILSIAADVCIILMLVT